MANSKEAKARLKINKLLEEAGSRFFDLPAEALVRQVMRLGKLLLLSEIFIKFT